MKTLLRLGLAFALAALPAAALAATSVTQVPNCTTAAYKPKRLVLACGDGSEYLAKLKWSRWTATNAMAAGMDEVNNCTPDCVKGRFKGYPVTVTLSRPRRCKSVKGHEVFGRIVLKYSDAHPGPKPTNTESLPCP
ncbi:MAG TPA: hypothetical protein VMD09_13420 [Solirubrobacteraceae bacterium]|nr:hypothetical protein [Solirubrobacteraceae bacterium]